jgi:hypothetical protein
MFKYTVILLTVFASFQGRAQSWQLQNGTTNIYYNGGNVGIGTTSPAFKLQLFTSTNLDGLGMHHSNGAWTNFFSPSMTGGAYNGITQPGDAGVIFGNDGGINTVTNGFVIAPHSSNASGLRIDNNGNVGIGATVPLEKLTVTGNIKLSGSIYWDWPNRAIEQYAPDASSMVIRFKNSIGSSQGNPNGGFEFADYLGNSILRIINNNVGIGNTNPDAKLTVSGQVHAQEVKVTVSAPGPDYVFEKDYALPSLDQVKTYIEENKHLPEVPSAKEMEKNGVQLGEMNMLLLKKIEELTLYVIELKKEVNDLKQNQRNTK